MALRQACRYFRGGGTIVATEQVEWPLKVRYGVPTVRTIHPWPPAARGTTATPWRANR